jgi:hypothetical protein
MESPPPHTQERERHTLELWKARNTIALTHVLGVTLSESPTPQHTGGKDRHGVLEVTEPLTRL